MAVYPSENPGVPLDPNTPVGQFRARSGDTKWTEYDPVEPGWVNYTLFSDAEIEAFLAVAPTMTWALYEAFIQLASTAALESKSVRDYDLQIDNTKRSADLRAIAEMWRSRAEQEDAASGESDYFDVSSTLGNAEFIPEGTVPIFGRAYVWSRWP